jgi:hypothetical protein
VELIAVILVIHNGSVLNTITIERISTVIYDSTFGALPSLTAPAPHRSPERRGSRSPPGQHGRGWEGGRRPIRPNDKLVPERQSC